MEYDGIYTKEAFSKMKKKEKLEAIQMMDILLDDEQEITIRLEDELEKEKQKNRELQLRIMQLEAQVHVLQQGSTTYILEGGDSKLWLKFRDYPHIVPYVPHGTGDPLSPPFVVTC